MTFQTGHIKAGGRKAGTPNKATSDLKARIAELIDNGFTSIVEDLELMEPKDRVAAYMRLIEYVLPKQREVKAELEPPPIVHVNISPEDYAAFRKEFERKY